MRKRELKRIHNVVYKQKQREEKRACIAEDKLRFFAEAVERYMIDCSYKNLSVVKSHLEKIDYVSQWNDLDMLKCTSCGKFCNVADARLRIYRTGKCGFCEGVLSLFEKYDPEQHNHKPN